MINASMVWGGCSLQAQEGRVCIWDKKIQRYKLICHFPKLALYAKTTETNKGTLYCCLFPSNTLCCAYQMFQDIMVQLVYGNMLTV